ncbi:Hypothetical predicted protein, partial [Pelobates cultripes]
MSILNNRKGWCENATFGNNDGNYQLTARIPCECAASRMTVDSLRKAGDVLRNPRAPGRSEEVKSGLSTTRAIGKGRHENKNHKKCRYG